MKTSKLNSNQENKKKAILINFRASKRIQWDTYRRYGLYSA